MTEPWGKFYAKTFTGSMMGAGSHVIAVMAYAVANAKPPTGEVELNPRLLSAVIGDPEQRISDAITYLEAPDPRSRTKTEEGRRLIKLGEFLYKLVNWGVYREKRDTDTRSEYLKEWDRKNRPNRQNSRDRRQPPPTPPTKPPTTPDNPRPSPTKAEAEAEAEAKGVQDDAPPTLAQVMAEAQFRGILEASARAFFNYHEDKNLWLNQHNRMINWKSYLRTWATNDRGRPVNGNKHTRVFPETQLKAIDDEISRHPANRDSLSCKGASTEEQRKDLSDLRKKRNDLSSQIARGTG